jgi:hypothetical protein
MKYWARVDANNGVGATVFGAFKHNDTAQALQAAGKEDFKGVRVNSLYCQMGITKVKPETKVDIWEVASPKPVCSPAVVTGALEYFAKEVTMVSQLASGQIQLTCSQTPH